MKRFNRHRPRDDEQVIQALKEADPNRLPGRVIDATSISPEEQQRYLDMLAQAPGKPRETLRRPLVPLKTNGWERS